MSHPLIITVDVEDWFQVENLRQCIPFSSWSSCELRVEKNIHRILDLLDSINSTNPTNPTNPINPTNPTNPTNPKSTFFVLGWIAERLPNLVREIHSRGHEVASHGYNHKLAYDFTSDDFKNELTDSKKLLEDIIGDRVYGYRAPNFFVNHFMLKAIEKSGYIYDSSYNSFAMNQRYGHLDLSQYTIKGIAARISKTFYELPISNIKLGKLILPWGGGGYFRLIPFYLFCLGVQLILKRETAYLFYTHPWEIDPEQPKVTGAPALSRFRHYVNLNRTYNKLSKFLEHFKEYRFITCYKYLELLNLI